MHHGTRSWLLTFSFMSTGWYLYLFLNTHLRLEERQLSVRKKSNTEAHCKVLFERPQGGAVSSRSTPKVNYVFFGLYFVPNVAEVCEKKTSWVEAINQSALKLYKGFPANLRMTYSLETCTFIPFPRTTALPSVCVCVCININVCFCLSCQAFDVSKFICPLTLSREVGRLRRREVPLPPLHLCRRDAHQSALRHMKPLSQTRGGLNSAAGIFSLWSRARVCQENLYFCLSVHIFCLWLPWYILSR